MKTLLLQNKKVGVNPTQVIDRDGSVIVDYCETIKKDGPAWDRLDAMLGE